METTFTVFPQLPLELRSKVWRFALLLFPRVIELKSIKPANGLDKNTRPWWIAYPTSKPILLSINRESRRILLPYYSAPFQARRISPRIGIEGLIISYYVDTLFINTEFQSSRHSDVLFRDLFGSYFSEVQDNLKRIACTETFWVKLVEEGYQKKIGAKRAGLMEEFTNLEEAIVVVTRTSPEHSVPWQLRQFVELHEGCEEWRRVEKELHPIFNSLRKERYNKRLCAKIETPSGT
jgi:hypothetical protein